MAHDVDLEKVLVSEVKDGIGTILVDRPQASNAMSARMFKKFIGTLSQWADDESIRVIIIRGTGERVFIGGADCKQIVGPKRPETEEEKVKLMRRDLAMATLMVNAAGRIEKCPQPVIAAINGVAFATGRMVAEACDIRIAADTVEWGEARISAEGSGKRPLGPYFQSVLRYINLVGLSRAMEILYMMKPISAQAGLEMGLFNMVVPQKDLAATAYEVARGMIQRFTPTALRSIKQIVQRVLNYQTPTVTDKEFVKKLVTDGYGTDDFIEVTKLWFRGQPPAVFDGKGPVRLIQFIDDVNPAAVERALEVLGVS
jgi:methylglutaconyl-CoA hydratase